MSDSQPKRYMEAETEFGGKFSANVWTTLLLVYRPFFFPMIFSLVIGFAGRLLLLANTNLIGHWIDTFCRAPAPCRPGPVWLLGYSNAQYIQTLLAITLVGLLLTLYFRLSFSRISARAISNFHDEVVLRTSRFPMLFFDTNPTGRIITRFSSDYGGLFRWFGGPFAELLGLIFDLMSMLILITAASPAFLVVCTVTGVLYYGIYRLNRGRIRAERRKLSKARGPSIAHFAETTQGAATIRAFQKQESFSDRFRTLSQDFLHQRWSTTRAFSRFGLQGATLTSFLFLSMGLAGLWLVTQGHTSVGALGVAFTFIGLANSTIHLLFEWLTQFEEALTGVERLDDYLRRPIEAGVKLPPDARFATGHARATPEEDSTLRTARLVSKSSAGVSFHDVWFRYRDDLPYVLKGVSFDIAAGERFGIIGRTGSGKSSIIQALFHLYPIDRGEVRIDGLAPSPLAVFRKSIALIPQDPVLFEGTVRDNLAMAGGHSDSAMSAALGKVSLGLSLDHPVEERGRNLSVGEKQLLCMARCLLQDSPVVAMDEATSAVDPQSEEIMNRATDEIFSDRTQIIVAHRLSTLEACDRVLWLHDGHVRVIGRPDEVLSQFRGTSLTV